MSLKFENINILQSYYRKIKEYLKQDFLIVGGVIRDLLLDIAWEITDIDVTLKGEPSQIYSKIGKKGISIFKTDKFGTITLVFKKQKLKVEITPLREEGQYLDFRHPNQIQRTDDIISDSQRRDFTINALYYTPLEVEEIKTKLQQTNLSLESFLNHLKKTVPLVFAKAKVIVISWSENIAKIWKNWFVDAPTLTKLLAKNWVLVGDLKELGSDWKRNWDINKTWNLILDPQNWLVDLVNKKLRAVGDPDKRFQEDALRIIRGARFINILNQKLKFKANKDAISSASPPLDFDRDKKTRRSAQKHFYLVEKVAKERINQEMKRVFEADNPFGFVVMLDKLNLLKFLFPALWQTKNVDQPVVYHPFDVYEHSILTLYHLQQINKKLIVKLAMLYHDVGKPDQYRYASIARSDEEKKAMHGSPVHHPIRGAELAKRDFEALGFGRKEIEEITFYIKMHMEPWNLIKGKPQTVKKKLQDWLDEFGLQKVLNLLDITIADRLGQYNPIQDSEVQVLKNLKKLARQIIKQRGRFTLKDLAINGNDIIKELNVPQWPKIGDLLKKAYDRVRENPKERNVKEKILEWLKEEA